MVLHCVRHFKGFSSFSSYEEFMVRIETLFGEELLNKRLKNLAVVLIINFTTIEVLNQDYSKCIPRQFGRVDISPSSHCVNVLINEIE